MSVNVTTIGPVHPQTRDLLREFKDERGLNYNEAIRTLLEEVDAD